MNYARCSVLSSKKQTTIQRAPSKKTGSRFGPRFAMDGGAVFQVSPLDVGKMIKQRGYEKHEIDGLYERGIINKWLRVKGKRKLRIILHDPVTGWVRGESRRTGLIGVKIGMDNDLDMWGRPFPVTLIQFRDNVVLQVKNGEEDKSNYCSLQVGAGLKRLKRVSKAMAGHFAKAGTDPKDRIMEFKISPNAILEPGTRLHVSHFVVGQYVDISGVSKGKGFAGVMKRHGFHGTFATHGVSKAHRKAGGVGQSSTPARIFKGLKMAGRMGGNSVTQKNLQILKINNESEIIWVKGSIPGANGSWVAVKDSLKSPHKLPPPFPTAAIKTNLPKYKRMKSFDPYFTRRHTDWVAKWDEAKLALKEKTVLDDDDEGDLLGL